MKALTIDCTTGKETWRDLTPEEIAQQEIETAAALAEKAALAVKEQERADAIAKLKASVNTDTQDLLIALGIA